jgi:hypothetical protein
MPAALDEAARVAARDKAKKVYDFAREYAWKVVVIATLMFVLFMAWSATPPTNKDNTTELARASFEEGLAKWQTTEYSLVATRFQELMVALCLYKTPLDDLSPALKTVMKQFTCDIGAMTTSCNSRHSIIAKAIRDQGLMPEYNEVNWYIVDTTFDDKRACVDLFNNHSSTVHTLGYWEKFYESEKQKNIENSKFKWSDMWTPIALWATAIWATIIMLCMIITAICRARFVNLNQFKV